MQYDVFFSISQAEVDGRTPSEPEMFRNFFEQVELADQLGFGVAWIAESHLSSQVQKQNRRPVIPHWRGEVGLNTDILLLASHVFRRTRRIEVGSAITNIVGMGGPVSHAERVASFLALHGLDPAESRRLHFGFASGRFEFMNEASGISARSELEEAAWPVLKGLVLREAAEIFVRLLRGDVLGSEDLQRYTLHRARFRTEDDWQRAKAAAKKIGICRDPFETIPVAPRWTFEPLKVVPCGFRRELLRLIIGSHDHETQEWINTLYPVQVFNLSITQAEVIEDTHRRMARAFHPAGGPWTRAHMPRTVMVFLNDQEQQSEAARSEAARSEAKGALAAYWNALEGTIDPLKVQRAAENALIGNVEQVAQQIVERFHGEDRLMLWFDFFNHDSARVMHTMTAFASKVIPQVESALARRTGLVHS
jgi:alkanesulfonate monooxygenase SsuD/methylene tetrahydromethanopterin reductase-like flavin-dependent oxidoreductase (luciferase family)